MDIGTVWPMLLLLQMLSSTPFGAAVVRRIGCMMPANSKKELVMLRARGRALNKATELAEQRGPFRTMVGDSSEMTVQVCVQRCWMKRFTFAALQASSQCFCANKKDGLEAAENSMCYLRCSGNCKQLCGGTAALSVYKTGYQHEPPLNDVDLSKGLLGCFAERIWKTWCGPPPLPQEHKARKQQEDHEKSAVEPPDEVLMATYKPPLVTVRMSASLCAAYCVSGPMYNPVAVLKSNDTCCCGKTVDDGVQRDETKVSFAKFCKLPCAERESRPYCVGSINKQRYISAYNTLDIWPLVTSRPQGLDTEGAWVKPIFPAYNKFEVSAFQPKWTPPDQDELWGLALLLPERTPLPPIEDPYNYGPWVSIVDVPEEDNRGGGWLWVLMAILMMWLFLSLTIAIILLKRRKTRHPEVEQPTEMHYPGYVETIPKEKLEGGMEDIIVRKKWKKGYRGRDG